MHHPIRLSLNEKRWRLFMVRREDKHFKSFADQVLKRDQHRCCYCGFQARMHQEVVNLDEDFNNNRLSNLVTACRLWPDVLMPSDTPLTNDAANRVP